MERARDTTPRSAIRILSSKDTSHRHTHSLFRMLWTRLTSHDSMAPYFPVPWSLGTSLSAFAQTPLPDSHGPLASARQKLSLELLERVRPHSPTHPNTPSSAPPSPCSSLLFLGANSAPTPPSILQLAPGRLTEARVAFTSSGTAKTASGCSRRVSARCRRPLPESSCR